MLQRFFLARKVIFLTLWASRFSSYSGSFKEIVNIKLPKLLTCPCKKCMLNIMTIFNMKSKSFQLKNILIPDDWFIFTNVRTRWVGRDKQSNFLPSDLQLKQLFKILVPPCRNYLITIFSAQIKVIFCKNISKFRGIWYIFT